MTTELGHDRMLEKVAHADGFIAALDQSGGSTPKALRLYGIPDDAYEVGKESMFDEIHKMRTRIITSPSFNGDRILGAILFEDTMDRDIDGNTDDGAAMPTCQYLWEKKGIVPFLKVDKGLEDEKNGVQLMKPIPELDETLKKAKGKGVFGTKMRSLIKLANVDGIREIVNQQFMVGKQILAEGLVPILEPEIDIKSPEKDEAEVMLKAALLNQLNLLKPEQKVMLKLTLPSFDHYYTDLIEHPNVLRVVALSGGYTREEANHILAKQKGMIASFSRALTEGLTDQMAVDEFDTVLDESIGSIFFASKADV